MRNIKKALCAVLALVLLLPIALTGCHEAKEENVFVVPESFDETKQFELTFWAKNDTNKYQVAIYEKAVADFEALYPNIKVNIRFYTDYAKIYQDVITNIATETTPNVCISYPDHISTYLSGTDTVVSLGALYDDEKYGLGGSEVRFDSPKKDEMIKEFLDEGILDGGYYAIPFMRSTEALYINKDLVEKLGYEIPDVVTWDFIWEVSDKAAEKDADGVYKLNGQKVMIPFIYKSTDNMMIQMLAQQNAGYADAYGNVRIFNNATKDILFAIRDHTKSGAFSTFKISSYPGNFLNAGQCLFAIDSTAGATWMGTEAPNLDIPEDQVVKFETVVRPIPQYNTNNPKMISQGPSVCIFNKEDPQVVLASWLFAQYLLTNDVQIAYSQTEGYVPVTNKAREAEEYKNYLASSGDDSDTHYSVKIDATKLLLDHVEDTFTTPVFNGSTSLREASGEMIERVTKSTRRKETVDDAYIEKLYSDLTTQYHLGESINKRIDFGPLPAGSVALLITLGGVWVLIALYFFSDKYIQKKKKKVQKD